MNITLMNEDMFKKYKERVEQDKYNHIQVVPTLKSVLEEHEQTVTPFGERLLATLSKGYANVYNIVSNSPFFAYYFDSTRDYVAVDIPGLMMGHLEKIVTAEDFSDFKKDDLKFMAISLKQLTTQLEKIKKVEKEGNMSEIIECLEIYTPTLLRYPIYQIREVLGYFKGEEEHALNFLLYMYNQAEYGFVQNGENIYIDAFKRILPFLTEDSPYHVSQAKGYHPKEMTIYRGVGSKSTPIEENPISWTTDEKVAHFFATRFDNVGTVIQGKVATKDILFYVDDRNESEIIVESKHVKVIDEYEVSKKENEE